MRKAQEESEKAFRESQAKAAKQNKKEDKSEHPPTPINYGDIDRIYAIIELMRDANYVKVRNTLPIFIKKIKSNAKSSKK